MQGSRIEDLGRRRVPQLIIVVSDDFAVPNSVRAPAVRRGPAVPSDGASGRLHARRRLPDLRLGTVWTYVYLRRQATWLLRRPRSQMSGVALVFTKRTSIQLPVSKWHCFQSIGTRL